MNAVKERRRAVRVSAARVDVRRAGVWLTEQGAGAWMVDDVVGCLADLGRVRTRGDVARALREEAADPAGVIRRLRPAVYRLRREGETGEPARTASGPRRHCAEHLLRVAEQLPADCPLTRAVLTAGLADAGVHYSPRAVAGGLDRLVRTGAMSRARPGVYRLTPRS